MKKFFAPDVSDKRLLYASKYLKKMGYEEVSNSDLADFQLIGINTDKCCINATLPVVEYAKDEAFAIENAYLTAEVALSLAVQNSDLSLVNSNALIVGYGRIGKALHKYLSPLTTNITVCARSEEAKALALSNGASVIDFNDLKEKSSFDFVFNTVPFPVFNEEELSALKKECTIMDLASFPGGVDKHISFSKGLNLVVARGLPGKYSPKSAGYLVAKTVYKLVEEGSI